MRNCWEASRNNIINYNELLINSFLRSDIRDKDERNQEILSLKYPDMPRQVENVSAIQSIIQHSMAFPIQFFRLWILD